MYEVSCGLLLLRLLLQMTPKVLSFLFLVFYYVICKTFLATSCDFMLLEVKCDMVTQQQNPNHLSFVFAFFCFFFFFPFQL